jgi:predicted O-methyltransferase YrrM
LTDPVSSPAARPTPQYLEHTPRSENACNPPVAAGTMDWYPPVSVGADSLAVDLLGDTERNVRDALELLEQLEPDDYSVYVSDFYRRGLARYGAQWRYADLVTAALVAGRWLKPKAYLEVGVRRGRSVCAMAKVAPDCDIVMFDMWMENYAGMDNPGPDFVERELDKVGHRGRREFVDGDSHETLGRYFAEHPDAFFDVINVDGDHSTEGAAQDIADVLPRLKIGGAFLFDDVANHHVPGLLEIWKEMVADDPRFSALTFSSVGYGVGVAIRRY